MGYMKNNLTFLLFFISCSSYLLGMQQGNEIILNTFEEESLRDPNSIFYAIYKDDLDKVNEFIKEEKDLNHTIITNHGPYTPLFAALFLGRDTMVQNFLKSKKVNLIMDNNNHPLHALSYVAGAYNSPCKTASMLRIFHDAGVDIDVVTYFEEHYGLKITPLYYAVTKNNLCTAKEFLKRGANPTHDCYKNTFSLIDLASGNKFQEMATLLTEHQHSKSKILLVLPKYKID